VALACKDAAEKLAIIKRQYLIQTLYLQNYKATGAAEKRATIKTIVVN
jgi:hypothetical protein